MLKLSHLIENFPLAKEALSQYAHDEADLDEMLAHFRISANAVYPFSRLGQPCFLRMAPVTEKNERNLRGEIEFLRYLEENGYPAMRPIRAEDGSFLLRLETRWGEYFACAFTGVPGTPIEDLPPTPELARAYGGALGRLHVLSAQFHPAAPKETHDDLLRWIRTQLAEYSAPEGVLRACDRLERELSALGRDAFQYGLVHYDFEPDNVFFDPDTGLCHAIDFDDGLYCWYAMDIEQALDCIDPALHGAFLSGYAAERPLPERLCAMRARMRRLADLRAYARLIRALADDVDPQPDWMPVLRARLQARCAQLGAKIGASLDE